MERVDDTAILRVNHDLDIASSAEIEKALGSLRDEIVVVVDLLECRYLDSSGLAVLLRMLRDVHILTICARDNAIRRIFEVSGVGKLLALFENEITALNAAAALKYTRSKAYVENPQKSLS